MLLHDARRAARTTADGELVLLEDQDRSAVEPRADRRGTRAGRPLPARPARRARTRCRRRSPPSTRARRGPQDTDWRAIARAVRAAAAQLRPSPVVELNRAVAVAMADGPAAGLALIDAIKARGELRDYYLLWAAEADLLRRLGRRAAGGGGLRRALALVTSEPERRFLARRLAEVGGSERTAPPIQYDWPPYRSGVLRTPQARSARRPATEGCRHWYKNLCAAPGSCLRQHHRTVTGRHRCQRDVGSHRRPCRKRRWPAAARRPGRH